MHMLQGQFTNYLVGGAQINHVVAVGHVVNGYTNGWMVLGELCRYYFG